MTETTATSAPALLSCAAGYDPIEDRLRQNIRATIEALFEEELAEFIGRCRYGRGEGSKKGYRHGHRERQLVVIGRKLSLAWPAWGWRLAAYTIGSLAAYWTIDRVAGFV